MESSYFDATAGVNVLLVNENGVVNHCVVNENVVMNACHHDPENKTSRSTAQEDGQVNVSPPNTEYSADIDSAAESGDASEAHHESPQSSIRTDCARTARLQRRMGAH